MAWATGRWGFSPLENDQQACFATRPVINDGQLLLQDWHADADVDADVDADADADSCVMSPGMMNFVYNGRRKEDEL